MSDEEEYFRKLDAEKNAKMKARVAAENAVAERERIKDLHYFKCGKCGGDMATRRYRGVEIEECGDCGAVLLDPGELQQLAGEDNTAFVSSFFSMFGASKE